MAKAPAFPPFFLWGGKVFWGGGGPPFPPFFHLKNPFSLSFFGPRTRFFPFSADLTKCTSTFASGRRDCIRRISIGIDLATRQRAQWTGPIISGEGPERAAWGRSPLSWRWLVSQVCLYDRQAYCLRKPAEHGSLTSSPQRTAADARRSSFSTAGLQPRQQGAKRVDRASYLPRRGLYTYSDYRLFPDVRFPAFIEDGRCCALGG